MAVTLTDPIVAPSRLTAAQVRAWYVDNWGPVPTAVANYLAEAERLCRLVGFDLLLIVAQSIHETSDPDTGKPWTSHWWRARHNPAGIGITGEPAQNEDSQTWANGTDAARAQVTHLALYVYGDWDEAHLMSRLAPSAGEPWVTLTDQLGNAEDWSRFQNVADAGYLNSINTLGDLGNGRWATDPAYAQLIMGRANELLRFVATHPEGGTPPMTTTPTIYDLSADYARFGLTQAQAAAVLNNKFPERKNWGVQGKPTFIVLHIQVGNTTGSLESWTERDASSTVMIQRDGSILRVIPEGDAPWTNGDDKQPTATGQRLVALPGNSNLWTLSIEAEGEAGTDVLAHPAQLDAIEWQVREWMTRYTIPVENVIRHGDVNTIDKANCPGAYYPEIIRRLKATPPTPDNPIPAPIWWGRDDIGLQTNGNGDRALAMLAETTTRGKEATLYAVAVAQKKYAIGVVTPGTRLTLRGTTKNKAGRGFGFVEVPGRPDQVARISISNLVEKWPTL